MQLQDLLKGLGFKTEANPEIHAIRYDSRQVGPRDLYVAIAGTRSDGHEHIPAALHQGAVAIVCDQVWYEAQSKRVHEMGLWLPCDQPRAALAALSANFYGRPASKLRMIGITGTNGKTTTSHLVSEMLRRLQLSTGWIGTLGAGFGDITLPGQYTTPFPPELHGMLSLMSQAGVQAVAMECSSHALEQHRLDAIAYDVAVFTNLTQDHLDYHHTMDAYADAKLILFRQGLKPGGVAVINRDDPRWERFAQASWDNTGVRVISYGIDSGADLEARELQFDCEGVSFKLIWQGQSHAVKLKLPGRYNVHNALAALGTALALDMPLAPSLEALSAITGVPGRLERVSPDGHPFAVYVDYAHTPDSLENALRAVRQFTSGKVRVVFGCGGDRDKGKRPLMASAAETLADEVYITSDNPRSEDPIVILHEIIAGLKQPDKALVENDRRLSIQAALNAAEAGDVVLIAGKGHENYQIIGSQTLHFDDREEARRHLANMNPKGAQS